MAWLDIILKLFPLIIELIKALKGMSKEVRAEVVDSVRAHARTCVGSMCETDIKRD